MILWQRLMCLCHVICCRTYLEQITAIDSRTVGSPANEILAVNYILDRVRDIQKKRNKVHKITLDVQRPTGTFSIDFLGGFTSYYDNITNIAVKLEPARGAQHAVLANCHFDSVANTPGKQIFGLLKQKPYLCSLDSLVVCAKQSMLTDETKLYQPFLCRFTDYCCLYITSLPWRGLSKPYRIIDLNLLINSLLQVNVYRLKQVKKLYKRKVNKGNVMSLKCFEEICVK